MLGVKKTERERYNEEKEGVVLKETKGQRRNGMRKKEGNEEY